MSVIQGGARKDPSTLWTSTCHSNNETRKILIETGSGFRYSKAVIYFLFVLRTINTFLTARYFSSGACLDMTNFAFSVFRFLNIFRDLQGKYFHMYSFCDWVKKKVVGGSLCYLLTHEIGGVLPGQSRLLAMIVYGFSWYAKELYFGQCLVDVLVHIKTINRSLTSESTRVIQTEKGNLNRLN